MIFILPSQKTPELLQESLSGQPPSGRLKRMALTTVFRLCNGKGGGGSSSDVEGGVRCDVRPQGETWRLGSERYHRSVVLCTCDRGCMPFLSLSALFSSLSAARCNAACQITRSKLEPSCTCASNSSHVGEQPSIPWCCVSPVPFPPHIHTTTALAQCFPASTRENYQQRSAGTPCKGAKIQRDLKELFGWSGNERRGPPRVRLIRSSSGT